MKFIRALAVVASCSALSFDHVDREQLSVVAPKLAALVTRAIKEPAVLARELRASPIAQLAPEIDASEVVGGAPKQYPIVVTHGMGDSCFNGGMKQITKAAGTSAGVYSVCVPGANNDVEDTLSAFLVTMDKNVDIFAEKVRADTKLAGGFNAFGLSQGNSVLRGYIERYNDPPVLNYLSIHGTVMGVQGFPNCNPAGILSSICDVLDEVLGDLAYVETIQNILFQANYFRDPMRVNTTQYKENSQIAQWNNENTVNSTLTANFQKPHSYTMVKAMKDSMVFPNEGEWWGDFEPGTFKVQAMADAVLYDNFGVKEMNEAGNINFDSTKGDHLDFTTAQLEAWVEKFFE